MSTVEHHTTAATPKDRINTLSIAGFVLAFVANIVGLVVSVIALVQIGRTGERGRGLAIAGIVVGGFWFALLGGAFLVHALVATTHGA
ncbi:DUF4190 domain-containing protein [Curtobacterium sp. CFBP9011]|uniref:DUF4190 domain-containing protein n=1 Tax=Curtobacterium sp. CFBP9011 TaxID=3096530 RepID=UPI002A69E610|nr:DUF4190 domain-containing protein [Curtobacterium sp. CFBP9011]MDY1003906.1 DUF4190 domain-containing protein [Curtobacterium sp. CFBP9011]